MGSIQTASMPEPLEVLQPGRQPSQVADAVAIAVRERSDEDLIENRVLVPEGVGGSEGVRQHIKSPVVAPDGENKPGRSRNVPGLEVCAPILAQIDAIRPPETSG